VNKQREANFSLKLRRWLMNNPRSSCSIEVKDTRGQNTFKLSEITDEQLAYSLAVRDDKGVLIRVQGLAGEPDFVYLRNEPSYFCIKYPKGFVLIAPDSIINERKQSKTLTWGKAKDVAVFTYE
jgi:hypothetical protein